MIKNSRAREFFTDIIYSRKRILSIDDRKKGKHSYAATKKVRFTFPQNRSRIEIRNLQGEVEMKKIQKKKSLCLLLMLCLLLSVPGEAFGAVYHTTI